MLQSVCRKLCAVATIIVLMGCASLPIDKYKVVKRTVTMDAQGKVLLITEEMEPVVPFNFWSTLIDVGKKAGGL